MSSLAVRKSGNGYEEQVPPDFARFFDAVLAQQQRPSHVMDFFLSPWSWLDCFIPKAIECPIKRGFSPYDTLALPTSHNIVPGKEIAKNPQESWVICFPKSFDYNDL
jgi:hypothetical protein